MKQLMGVVWVGMVVFLSGCAGLDVQTIGMNSEKDQTAKGYRYYQASPYLLVATDNKGGLNSQIIYLPDMMKKMSVRPYAYGASNESTLKFENGVLTQAAATVDETIIPKAVLDSLKDVLAAAAKAAAFNVVEATQTTAPAPSLYKIVVHGDQISLIGGQGVGADGSKVIKTSAKVSP
jgi:hypothetical protein